MKIPILDQYSDMSSRGPCYHSSIFSHILVQIKLTGYIWLIFCQFYKGDNFCDLVCFPAYKTPSQKGAYPKREEFAPFGSKFFPFRVEPPGRWEASVILTVNFLESVSIGLKGRQTDGLSITKTSLFKYTENFTTKN